ncbi:hypothetical protein NQ317_016826 [Molorchus minor]|uniref:Uncharacterized protein n=1 Tax=Molorchus minor TaxID=1323400 RepID=A0ABQ9JP66_9CUCU|nr:hypothetical protein NQ317_016826 [Molorchus minor]
MYSEGKAELKYVTIWRAVHLAYQVGRSNLELLSPEERKHYKKRKEYIQMDTEERNAYNGPTIARGSTKSETDEYELRNDVTVALEELQDDVFENGHEELNRPERMKRSPRRSDKLYVQKKNKFEVTPKPNSHLNRQGAQDLKTIDLEDGNLIYFI